MLFVMVWLEKKKKKANDVENKCLDYFEVIYTPFTSWWT